MRAVLFVITFVLTVVAPAAHLLATASVAGPAGAGAGRRVTVRRAWWPDGGRRLEARLRDDAFHGEYLTWYPNGRLYERRHFVNGREEGRQQSWTPDGRLFLNYEVRRGRRYGFVNARPCLPVEEAR